MFSLSDHFVFVEFISAGDAACDTQGAENPDHGQPVNPSGVPVRENCNGVPGSLLAMTIMAESSPCLCGVQTKRIASCRGELQG